METELPVQEDYLPRIYRVDASTRRGINLLVFVLAALFLFDSAVLLRGFLHHSVSLGNLIFVVVCSPVVVGFLGTIINKRVILHRDTIEVAGWFYSRKLTFAEIRGYCPTRSSSYVLLLNTGKRGLALPPFLHTDQFFRDWIKSIPKSHAKAFSSSSD